MGHFLAQLTWNHAIGAAAGLLLGLLIGWIRTRRADKEGESWRLRLLAATQDHERVKDEYQTLQEQAAAIAKQLKLLKAGQAGAPERDWAVPGRAAGGQSAAPKAAAAVSSSSFADRDATPLPVGAPPGSEAEEHEELHGELGELFDYHPHDDEPPIEGRDNLKRIHGIGRQLEKKLNDVGIYTYSQIGEWSEADMLHYANLVKVSFSRIVRERWVECAQEEMKKQSSGLFF